MENRSIPIVYRSDLNKKLWSRIAQNIHYGYEAIIINAQWDALKESREIKEVLPNGSYKYYKRDSRGEPKTDKLHATDYLIPDVSNSIGLAVAELEDIGFRDFSLAVSYNGIEGRWIAACQIRNFTATESRADRNATIASAILKAIAVTLADDLAPKLAWGGENV
jgi:hypothetical protein